MKLRERFDKNDTIGRIIYVYFIVIIFSIIAVYPISTILTISLRPGDKVLSTSLALIPPNATLENYKIAFFDKPTLRWILNSLIVSSITTVVSLLFAASAGYALSRYKFKGKKTLMVFILANQLFPLVMVLLPLNILIRNVGLGGNFGGLLLPYIAANVPFTALLLKGYFDTIPRSLEESAYVDGAGPFYTFFFIILPLAKPALAVGGIFCFLGAWTEFIIARVLINNEKLYTLPLGLVTLQGQFATQWGVYSAAALITSIPVMIMFVILSRYIVSGLTVGSTKE